MKFRIFANSVLFLTLVFTAKSQTTQDFSQQTARSTVEWARDGVIYEIYPRVFSRTGNFNGVTARLDELKKTGVDILWLMPVNPIGVKGKKGNIGSPYAIRDYYEINPAYGTKADLKRLVAEAHKRGMKVITDQVLNHTAWDNKLITTHPEFYKHDKNGKITYPEDWTDVAWLDYSNPKLRKYMIAMLKYWMTEFDLDGFRFDVAHKPPTDFWEQARAEVEKVKPNVFWLAEGERPADEVKAMDADYSWELHNAITSVFQGQKPATAIRVSWQKQHDTWPKGALHMRFSDNHDERRAIARFGEKGALAAQALVFTLDGIPLVYNGMEIGDTAESGAPALFENLKIFWPFVERRKEFPRFYKSMIALRKSSEALRRGELQWVANSKEDCLMTFIRRSPKEEVLSVVNGCSVPVNGSVEISSASYTDVTPSLEEKPQPAFPSTLPNVSMKSWEFRVYRRSLQ